MIFNLEHSLLLKIIGSWISVEEFGILDSAVCNKRLRTILIHKVSNQLTFDEVTETDNVTKSNLLWMALKGISAKKLIIQSWSVSFDSSPTSTALFTKVQHVVIPKQSTIWPNDMLEISTLCCKMNTLTVLNDSKISVKDWHDVVKCFPNLTELHMQQCNHLNDSCLEPLAKSSRKLQMLNLSHCKVSSFALVRFVKSCIHLHSIILSNMPFITGIAIKGIATIRAMTMQHLSISGLKDVTDSVAAKIAAFVQLTFLDVSRTNVSADGLKHILSKCTQLTHLDGSHCRVKQRSDSDDDDDVLESEHDSRRSQAPLSTRKHTITSVSTSPTTNPNLTWLSLSGTNIESWKDTINLSELCPNLTHLDMGGCDYSECGVESLKLLRYIDLSLPLDAEDNYFTGKRFYQSQVECQVVLGNEHLTAIHLRNHEQNTSSLYDTIANAACAVHITVLDLSVGDGASGVGMPIARKHFVAMLTACKRLKVLKVNYNSVMCDDILLTIAAQCSVLGALEISGCDQLSNDVLNAYKVLCPDVMMVNDN